MDDEIPKTGRGTSSTPQCRHALLIPLLNSPLWSTGSLPNRFAETRGARSWCDYGHRQPLLVPRSVVSRGNQRTVALYRSICRTILSFLTPMIRSFHPQKYIQSRWNPQRMVRESAFDAFHNCKRYRCFPSPRNLLLQARPDWFLGWNSRILTAFADSLSYHAFRRPNIQAL